MPTLKSNKDITEGQPILVDFDLRRIETYSGGEYEGWIEYTLTLSKATKKIISISGTILEGDVAELAGMLRNAANGKEKAKYFEPMEPDFNIRVRHLGFDGQVELIIFVDEGITDHECYSGDGVGVLLNLDSSTVKQFAEDLEDRKNELIKSLSSM